MSFEALMAWSKKLKTQIHMDELMAQLRRALAAEGVLAGLAKGFGLTTVGEGVEEEDQRACLEDNGCTEGQGYLFSEAG